MITKRERKLMQDAMNVAPWYDNVEDWLEEIISDGGHTVEEYLDHYADSEE